MSANTLVKLENSLEFSALLSRLGGRVIASCFPRVVKLQAKIGFLLTFHKTLIRLRKAHGSVYVVKYLKGSQLALQKLIAGTPFSSLREIEPDLPLPRLINGLPRLIPLSDRKFIRMGSTSIIRY